MILKTTTKVASITLFFILILFRAESQSVYPFALNMGGSTILSLDNFQLEWNFGESVSIKYFMDSNTKLQTGLLQPTSNSIQSNGTMGSTIDIGFVLQGYDSSRMFYDTSSFTPFAQNIVRMLNELSFGRVSSYKTYMGEMDKRSPSDLTSELNIMTLQASLDGWPDSRWDWLRGYAGFWYSVPSLYRPIITNAINWLSTNKKTFADWRLLTSEGKTYGDSIQNNVIRMGPDASEAYLKSTRLPANYNPIDHKVTFLAFNTNRQNSFDAAAANLLYYMGVRMNNGDSIPLWNVDGDHFQRVSGLFVSIDSNKLSNQAFYYTAVHELVHAFGVGTHDRDPNYINKAYGILNSHGDMESIHALPAWDRYFFAGWLSKNTITTNIAEVSDLKGKFQLSDTSKKYILQIVQGDARGCGGTYKELYDGKWYTYTVNDYGTLTFTEGIDNINYGSPMIEVQPFDRVVTAGEKTFFNVQSSGIQNSFIWKKNGVVINNATTNYLSFHSAKASDSGLYQVIISNSKGTVSSNIVKLVVQCPEYTAPVISSNKTTSLCQGDSVLISSTNPGLNYWYKDGVLLNTNTSTLTVKQNGVYTNVVEQLGGCKVNSNAISVNYTIPIVPILSISDSNKISSTSKHNIWYKEGVALMDSTQFLKPSTNGYYTAKSVVNGCISAMSNPFYYLVTDILNISETEYIRLAPNPVEDIIYLDFKLRNYNTLNVEVVNVSSGNLVTKKTEIGSRSPIDLSILPSGVYAFKVTSRDNKIAYTFKIVKI